MEHSQFNSRSGNKRDKPQRNGRYGKTKDEEAPNGRSPINEKRNPPYSHGIMR